MLVRLWALLGSLLLICSCAQVGVVSPYAKLGTKEVYTYGTFCGPRLPVTELPRLSDEKRAFLLATPAQDSIDMACKIHDVCYEFYQHDNFFCDQAIISYLQHGAAGEFVPMREHERHLRFSPNENWILPSDRLEAGDSWAACASIASEIVQGISLKQKVTFLPEGHNKGTWQEWVSQALFSPTSLALTAFSNNLPLLDAANRFASDSGGCIYSDEARKAARYGSGRQITRAAIVSECGCKSQSTNAFSVSIREDSCSSECVTSSMRRSAPVIDKLLGRETLQDVYGEKLVSIWVQEGHLP